MLAPIDKNEYLPSLNIPGPMGNIKKNFAKKVTFTFTRYYLGPSVAEP